MNGIAQLAPTPAGRLRKLDIELLVRKAARAGLCVPREPGAMASAKELSKESFLAWISANPSEASSLALIEAGILADGGARLWHAVQQAFAVSDAPPLFRALEEPNHQR